MKTKKINKKRAQIKIKINETLKKRQNKNATHTFLRADINNKIIYFRNYIFS